MFKEDESIPGTRAVDMGTPKEYTEHVYEVYFEVGEYENTALNVFEKYLGENRKGNISKLSHGYHLKIPLQSVPDLVRLLGEKNIAIYQIVRYARADSQW